MFAGDFIERTSRSTQYGLKFKNEEVYPLNKKHFWLVGLVIVMVVFVAYNLFTSIPYSVSKSYDESIYNRSGQVVKTVPVRVNGKVYRGIFRTNEFVGLVNIDGKTYSISTFRNRRFFGGGTTPSYPYVGVVSATNSQNLTVTTASIMISGDFNATFASTDEISKKYGKGAELTVPVSSKAGGK